MALYSTRNAFEVRKHDSVSNSRKEIQLMQCVQLAESQCYEDCFQLLYNTFIDFNINAADIYHVVNILVEKLRHHVVGKIERDPLKCPMCYGLLHEAITLDCAHTYCSACCTTLKCVICGQQSDPTENRKRNILTSNLVRHVWKKEYSALDIRKEAIKVFGGYKVEQDGHVEDVEGDVEDALALFSKALRIFPTEHVTLSYRSNALLQIGKKEAARKDAEAAIRARPHWYNGHLMLSNALCSVGKLSDAAASLLAAVCLIDQQKVPVHTGHLAELIHRQLARDAKKNLSGRRERVEHIPRDDPAAHLSLENVSGQSSQYNSPEVASRAEIGTGKGSGPIHFKKLWKDKCLSTSLTSIDTCHEPLDVLQIFYVKFMTIMKNIKESSCVDTPVPTQLNSVDDFECALCMRTVWQPVSTPCGHTFCRVCLNRSLDHTHFCPLCKQSLSKYLAARRFNTNGFVDALLQKTFPETYNTRMLQAQAELDALSLAGRYEDYPIPIFVATLAMPLMNCPLHVFEPRYKLMIRRCMESGTREFGMCNPGSGSDSQYSEYGTTLEISDIRYLPDGRSVLNTVGKRRFRVMKRDNKDGYNIAVVDVIKDKHPVNLTETQCYHDKLRRTVEIWLRKIPREASSQIVAHCGELPQVEPYYWLKENGSDWLWWLANVLPLHPLTKESLIKSRDLHERLCLLNNNMVKFLTNTWKMGISKRKNSEPEVAQPSNSNPSVAPSATTPVSWGAVGLMN